MKKPIGLFPPFFVLLGLGFLGFLLPEKPGSPLVEILASPQIYLLLASGVLYSFFQAKPGPFSFHRWSLKKQLGIGVVISIVPAVLFLLAWYLLEAIDSTASPAVAVSVEIPWQRWVILLILAPIAEELFFRGLLARAIRNFYPTWVAVVFSAAIFGFSHGGFVLGPTILGIITGLLYLRSGSILPGILFHSIANCYVPLVLMFFPSAMERIRFLL